MAVVAGIEQQFERLQRAANGDDGGPVRRGLGQRRERGGRAADRGLGLEWGDARAPARVLAVEPAVTLLGGEYCFLPSIAFLRGLAHG